MMLTVNKYMYSHKHAVITISHAGMYCHTSFPIELALGDQELKKLARLHYKITSEHGRETSGSGSYLTREAA